MNDDIAEMDPRLAATMQWLKDKDKTGLQENEHRNKFRPVPEIIEDTDYD
jgi:hypothetical protein